MPKNVLSEESRIAIKSTLNINITKSKNNCRNCHYRPVDYICNKHFIKTENNETCQQFKKDIKFTFVNGGRMSPR
ncbi:hypothetical protein ABE28_009160 [Peribacillus muralis]|uniref:Uncharacterized protein n=1 Tax=Peribacillus muralis TaxID=264697 RepID=A0A1B3XMS3_9BACI|nr:hypothetical protein [Peribacillus muralis]AOH54519.1 hypothetical protein ABE28_009160 [Peribacillus muralis]